MEVLRELMRKPRAAENLAISFFVIAVIYTIIRGTAHTVLAGVAFTLMMLGAMPKQVALAFLVGASVILLLQTSGSAEGFTDGSGGSVTDGSGDKSLVHDGEPTPTPGSSVAEAEAAEKEENATKEAFSSATSSKVMLPDNATRREPLELGKPYKLPSESDDKGYHLDAGTTFLNAYKALKPEQIAAMTKDTQDLLATQQSLVAMLDSFAPLMKDMGKITGFFNNFK
jgi:hypothetical protein